MHETELQQVRLHIDRFEPQGRGYALEGWVLGLNGPLTSLRIAAGGAPLAETSHFSRREDVIHFYRIAADAHVGFRLELADISTLPELRIEVRYPGQTDYLACKTIKNPFCRAKPPEGIRIRSSAPSLVVAENFYSDPDALREYALSLEFIDDQRYYKGRRTAARPIIPGTKERFEGIRGRHITNWETHVFNGVFQYCIAQDSLVYHCDNQSYAAMVYLSPDAPGETGTSFFRHKKTGLLREPGAEDCQRFGKSVDELRQEMFRGNYYDRTPWECLDVVGNVYNRLVIFDAKRVHAASGYCGDNKENGRLFQIFFFDVAD